MKTKIAIYSGVIPSTTFIENLVRAVADSGNEVLLFGVLNKSVKYLNSNIVLHPLPVSRITVLPYILLYKVKLIFQSVKKYRLLKKHIQESGNNFNERIRLWAKFLPVVYHNPDIFHVQWTNSAEEWMFLKLICGSKIIVSLRGAQLNIAPIVKPSVADRYTKIFPLTDGFHAVSKTISQKALQYGASKDKIDVIYSGIDLVAIKRFEKTSFSISNPVQIISVGRVHWTKGYNYALDGLRQLFEMGIDFNYTIITDSLPEEIIFQIADEGFENRVKVHYKFPQTDVFKAMQQADLLLLPSIEEGIANVVLEAMALRLPVVSSDCGGMAEVINHGKTGFLFTNRNTEKMALSIKDLINLTEADRSAITISAQKKIEEQHNLSHLGINMNKLYHNVLCA